MNGRISKGEFLSSINDFNNYMDACKAAFESKNIIMYAVPVEKGKQSIPLRPIFDNLSCDKSLDDLSNVMWSGCLKSRSTYVKELWRNSAIKETKFDNTTFDDMSFMNMKFSLINFSRAKFCTAFFDTSSISDSHFLYANLKKITFYKTNIIKSLFTSSTAYNLTIKSGIIQSSDFSYSELKVLQIINSKINNSHFSNLKKTYGANFSKDQMQANFSKSELDSGLFKEITFTTGKTLFEHTKLTFSTWEDIKFENNALVSYQNADLSGSTWSKISFPKSSKKILNFSGANLSQANFDKISFSNFKNYATINSSTDFSFTKFADQTCGPNSKGKCIPIAKQNTLFR